MIQSWGLVDLFKVLMFQSWGFVDSLTVCTNACDDWTVWRIRSSVFLVQRSVCYDWTVWRILSSGFSWVLYQIIFTQFTVQYYLIEFLSDNFLAIHRPILSWTVFCLYTHFFYRQERIKRVPSWQNFIANIFHGQWRIKRNHYWWIFYRGRQIIVGLKNVNKQKNANNETEYEEYSVTDEVLSYFNIYKCGRSLLNRLDVTFERAWTATMKDKYYLKMLVTPVNYNDCNNTPSSNKKIRQAVRRVMEETEE